MSSTRPLLLVVDDDPSVLDVLGRFGQRLGFEVESALTGAHAFDRLRERSVDAALVDLQLPDTGGLEVLRTIRDIQPSCQVILITGYASIETAVEAVKLGAMDYLSKPVDFARLERLLSTVLQSIDQRRSLLEIEADLARRLEFCGMIGRSAAMQSLFDLVRRLAPHLRTALVVGETGTGKELVARALHDIGPRRTRPFSVASCSVIQESSFEIELFGSVAGTVPGVTETRPGLFELADGGTVFLDEVSGLPLSVQARLLRLIEFGELHRVGSPEARRVDLQIVAATQKDLRVEVAAGRFRSDLFYRLNVVEVALPPLRDRREDVPYLTAAFIRDAAQRMGKAIRGVTTAAEAMLIAAPWDGNVRELRNVLERACLVADGDFVTERELGESMPSPVVRANGGFLVHTGGAEDDGSGQLLSTVEREHILRALQRAGGNKKAAARMLGVSRRALYRRLERLDLGATITRRRAGVGAVSEVGY